MSEKSRQYELMHKQLSVLLSGETDPMPNLSNTAALIFNALPQVSWAGFYLIRDNNTLLLGPFQGKPACIRIPLGKGVCGTAAQTRQPQVVPDVHLFPGHIACDSASESEIVLPMLHDGRVIGVLDLDSTVKNRFDLEDCDGLQTLVDLLIASCEWN